MSIRRREFLKTAVAGSAVATVPVAAEARPNLEPPPKAIGMLYDSTLCIGCKACMSACKEANGMPPEPMEGQPMWDAPVDTSGKTINIIKLYKDGTAQVKDQEEDGYAFVKRHCMHCVDPGCVSVCPVTAMRKDPETGVVTHHPEACIGCRYCVWACPYDIPKWDFTEAFGQIHKCQFCNHRLAEGKLPACVEHCPTGASLFGTREELIAEAHRRMELEPGSTYRYPMNTLDSGHWHEKTVPHYQQHLYGETQGGGTQVMVLAGVPFEKLDLPLLPERSFAAASETIQHTVYKGMLAPLALLGGLMFVVGRNRKGDGKGDGHGKGGE